MYENPYKNLSLEQFMDPIAREARIKERDQYLEGLFEPITSEEKTLPMKWLVPGFLPLSYLVLLAADPNEGKSSLATALALSVATGTPFAGMPTKQHAVLWLSGEENRYERRLLTEQSPLSDPATPLYTCYQKLPIDHEDSLDALGHWISQTDAGLIVVDPLYGCSTGRSMEDGWAARRTLQPLKDLCAQLKVTALVLHHATMPTHSRTRKRVAESAQLAAVASMDIILTHRNLPSLVSSSSRNEGGAGEGRNQTARAKVDLGAPKGRNVIAKGNALESGPALPSASPVGAKSNPQSSRLVTLSCRGRGDFANKTIHLLSHGPLNYMRVDDPKTTLAPDVCRPWMETRLLNLLATGSKTSVEMMHETKLSDLTLRNAVTNLRRDGLVKVTWSNKEIRRFGLTQKGKEMVSETN